MNKKILLFTLASIMLIAGCGKKKEKVQTAEELLRPASMTYTKQDTADIKYLVNTYVSYFGKGDLDGCADMLYTFRNDSVFPYTKEQKDKFKNAFSVFHFYGSEVQRMILRSDRNNRVDIALQILKDGNIAKNKGTMTFSLNPVVIKGKWYLTLMDTNAQGVTDVYKDMMDNENR